MAQLINVGNWHTFICGISQSGKSTLSKAALLALPYPVIYFNIQNEDMPRGFMRVFSSKIEPKQLLELVEDGAKVNLVLDFDDGGYEYTAGYILRLLMNAGRDVNHPVYVCIDECHLLEKEALRASKYVATAGLKKGVRLVCVTQRPANCDKTLYTQCFEHYIFFLSESEAAYMKSKGIDYGFCKGEWDKMGKYSYCFSNGYTLEGRPPIKI
jgi:hypothetical protein